MGVSQRHIDRRVPHQLLDGLEGHAAHGEVRGERVAQPIHILPMNRRSRRSTIDTIRLAVKR